MNTRKYLLGLLSEKQQYKIENNYFTDDSQFEKMLAAEDDLIEAYINNELSTREKKQTTRNYTGWACLPRLLSVYIISLRE